MTKTNIKLAATCFCVGYIPWASGTFGSFLGLAVYLCIKDYIFLYSLVLIFSLIIGFLVCKEAEDIFGCKDSPKIVVDEFNGILITFFLVPFSAAAAVSGFLLFRLLDIFKPYPARALEKVGEGRGVMLDDIVCGIYANIILQIVFRFML